MQTIGEVEIIRYAKISLFFGILVLLYILYFVPLEINQADYEKFIIEGNLVSVRGNQIIIDSRLKLNTNQEINEFYINKKINLIAKNKCLFELT